MLKEICFLDNNNTTFILLDNETNNLITYNGKYLIDTNDSNVIKIFENNNSENYLFRITTYVFNFNDLLINFKIIINNKGGGDTDFGGSAIFIGNKSNE